MHTFYLYTENPDSMRIAHKVDVDDEQMVWSFDDEKFEEPVPLKNYAPFLLTEKPIEEEVFRRWCQITL